MLNSYTNPQLTLEMLTNELIDEVMESLDFPVCFPTDVVRAAAYQILAHNAVWDKEFSAYKDVALKCGSVNSKRPNVDDIFSEISFVAHQVNVKILEKQSATYAEGNISSEQVVLAMERACVTCEETAMRTLLGDLVVGGKGFLEENDRDALRVFGVSVSDVVNVAMCYGTHEETIV